MITWCTGCGHFGILNSIKTALDNIQIDTDNLSIVSGIGCSGRIFEYLPGYNFHSAHGRALPVAQGIKCGNKNLQVIATGGDGDGFAIGLSHALHAMRRNIDITYIVMSNRVYGLTKGHTSPMSYKGFATKSTPFGNTDSPLDPILLSLSLGTGFIAQGFSGNPKQLTKLIEMGIEHKGFSFINVFSPCITFNKVNTYKWYQENLYNLDEDERYDYTNLATAITTTIDHEGLITGLIYKSHTLEESDLYITTNGDTKISEETFYEILKTL